MALEKYKILSVSVSQKVGDEVSTYDTDGELFSKADRLGAINRAVGNVYTQILNQLGEQVFINLFPEFVGKRTVTFASQPYADVRKYLTFYTNDFEINGIPPEKIAEALYGGYSNWKPTNTRPRFVEVNGVATVYPTAVAPTTAEALYIKQPTDITHTGSDDVIVPYAWLDMVASEAAKLLLQTQQIF